VKRSSKVQVQGEAFCPLGKEDIANDLLNELNETVSRSSYVSTSVVSSESGYKCSPPESILDPQPKYGDNLASRDIESHKTVHQQEKKVYGTATTIYMHVC
jgi:hypothetical protein